MNTIKLFLTVLISMVLVACGGSGSGGGESAASVPAAPTGVVVAAGATVGATALVSFTAPASDGGSAVTGYTVTTVPGGITASGTTSPIALTGLTAGTDYNISVTALNATGSSVASWGKNINTYNVVATFHEPMTQPNDSIFTGTFTFDSINHTVSNLTGSLTQSMTKAVPGCTGMGCAYGGPMTTATLNNQLSSAPATLGGVDGLLVTAFALNSTDTFDVAGFAPGGTQYFGLTAGAPNNHNAYAMIFVNTADPTTALAQAQIDKLAYADCTPGGMMMTACMTGTTVDGYGRLGTMKGTPVAQVITKQ
jgi:hypothetical protein